MEKSLVLETYFSPRLFRNFVFIDSEAFHQNFVFDLLYFDNYSIEFLNEEFLKVWDGQWFIQY